VVDVVTDFEHFVCWQRDRTYVVLNPDAEHIDDDVFYATHTDLPLSLLEASPDVRPGLPPRRWTMGFQEFLDQFLSPSRQHVQVVVLGDAGSGKSHFIHWLALHIPEEPGRRVLSIPRSGLSLRGVVERILNELPGEQQVKYREQLDRTGFHNARPEAQRSRLLAELAIAIEADEPHDELEEILLAGLPHLFRDPNYADYLRISGGVVDDLVAHISETHGYERRDQRRSFDVNDLPLEAVNIGQLADRTRRFMAELRGNPEFVEPAIGVINRNLDRAIGQVLNFTGDQLVDLMRDMRRALRQADRTLVLLIEDFARLQGIDYPLLQALIESAAASDDLCEIRWAMAMTTGYYGRTVDTVRTRMDFVIDMDLPTRGEAAVFDEETVVAFAARYLNAVRLDASELGEWRAASRDSADVVDPPSRCTGCVFRPRCHQAFGDVNGVGLYPFNRRALIEMSRRVDPSFDERFNPRMVIKGVLAEVLGNRLHEFDSHAFPSERFLESMRGTSLQPVTIERLQRASPEHAQRQVAVLELWGTPGQITAVEPGIYDAFGMPAPGLEGLPPPSPTEETGRAERASAADPLLDAVRAWGRGDPLADQFAARLHNVLYAAIVGYVDWDAAGIQQTWAASRTGSTPFRARSIIFRRQSTNPPSRVVLRVPATSDQAELRQAAIALEGLVQFQRSGSWSFAEGDLKLISLKLCLDRWSADLLTQLRALVRTDRGDSADQAMALLAVGVALAGVLDDDRPSIQKITNKVFEPWPSQASAESQTWRRLYRETRDLRDRLVELVRAWSSGGKGGQVGAFLDGGRIARATSGVRSGWRLEAAQDVGDDGATTDPVARLLGRVAQDLPVAVAEELARIREWIAHVGRQVPEGVSGKALQGTITEIRQAAAGAGIQVPKTVQDALDEALEGFGPVLFDRAAALARRLVAEPDPLSVLPSVASARLHQTMDATARLLVATDRYVGQVEASVATREDNQVQRSADVDRDRRRIDALIDRLISILVDLESTE
jgi:hypothetical protein